MKIHTNTGSSFNEEDLEFYRQALDRQRGTYQPRPVIKEIVIKERKNKKRDKTVSIKYSYYKDRAESKGFPFEFTSEELDNLILQPCHYCGSTATGLDRVDNHEGYTKDNSVACCGKCNMMKYNHSKDDFITHLRKIITHLDQAD